MLVPNMIILKRLYNSLIGSLDQKDINQLHEEGIYGREKLKGESKSAVSRKLKREEQIRIMSWS